MTHGAGGARLARVLLSAIVLLASARVVLGAPQQNAGPTAPVPMPKSVPRLRITSPIGRTGTPTTVRIVAQIEWTAEEGSKPQPVPLHVTFRVDGTVVGTVDDGPPYAVTWTDENPFESRVIVVQAETAAGLVVRDEITLPAFEIVDRSEVASILVDTAVYDRHGRPASSLEREAFGLLENDQPQTLDLVQRETLPTTVVLLVDNSQSMARRMAAVRHAAERFGVGLVAHDTIIVAPFNRRIGVITGPTADVPTVADAVGAMAAGGGTAILDAVRDAATLLSDVNGRHAIILITDGFDENSTIGLDDAVTAVRKAQATLYTVALGGVNGVSLTGEAALRRLADTSGGRSFFPWRDSDLDAVAQTIVEDAHSRYLLSYTSSNQDKDGAWRRITVKVPEGYTVRARDGYRAALPPPIRPVLEFRATDTDQRQVTLATTDIEVFEDGVLQTIDTFQEAVDPVSVVLLLDASGSMVKSADAVRATARQFVAALRPEDSLAVATFADRVKFGHLLGTNRASSAAAIDAYQAAGGTALYDGIWEALDVLKAVPGRRAVVVLTDGRDENNAGTAAGSVHTEQDVLAMARQTGAAMFTIGLGNRVAQEPLRRLAQVGGGETYTSLDATRLEGQFRAVIENLRQRYTLSYTSTNVKHDGAWRRVDIRPRRNGLVFAGASGYFGPER